MELNEIFPATRADMLRWLSAKCRVVSCEERMKKISVLAATAFIALCAGSMSATAGVMPGVGEAAKSAVEETKAGVIEQVFFFRRHRHHHHHHHRRHHYGRRW